MTIEEAIEVIESIREWSNTNPPDYEEVEALDIAISALRAQQGAEKNEALTRKQLQKMDGQPVWIEFIPEPDGDQIKIWALVSVDPEDGEIFLLNSLGGSSAYEEVWADIRAIYRRPPEKEEHNG